MFPGCLQDFSRMFSGCSDGSYWPGGIWWSFQMKVWTLKIQRNPMIPNYSLIPAAAIWWSPAIRWSIRSMDFDNRKVYGDTSITDGLVFLKKFFIFFENSFVFWENLKYLLSPKKQNFIHPPRLPFTSSTFVLAVILSYTLKHAIGCIQHLDAFWGVELL